MNNRDHRFWFRFSLRTLFVLVTLIAVWLGWTLNWIRQRHEFLRDQRGVVLDPDPEVTTRAPACLWLFGEVGAEYVQLSTEDPSAYAQAERLFPEAIVLGKYTIFNWHRWFRARDTR